MSGFLTFMALWGLEPKNSLDTEWGFSFHFFGFENVTDKISVSSFLYV